MTSGKITKLIQIINNNKQNNILIMGTNGSYFEDAIIIPSSIPTQHLGIGIDDNGNYIYPSWLRELDKRKDEDNILLIIDGLDKISKQEQEKFYGILKHKGINGYKFSDNIHIICTSKSTDTDNISDRILGLSIIYNF